MALSMVDAVSWSDPLEQLDSVARQDHPLCKADHGYGDHRDLFATGEQASFFLWHVDMLSPASPSVAAHTEMLA